MEAHVEGLAEATQRDAGRALPPQVGPGEVNHSCAERVATVATPSTMARHAGSRATSPTRRRAPCPRRPQARRRRSPARDEVLGAGSLTRAPVRLGLRPRVAVQLVVEWPPGPARETAHPHQRLVAAPPRRQVGLPGELDRLDRVPVRRPEAVQAPEEAELDATTNEASYMGAKMASPVPAFIRQKIDPLKSKSIRPASWRPRPAAKPGLPWSPPSYAKVRSCMPRTIGDCDRLRGCAVLREPLHSRGGRWSPSPSRTGVRRPPCPEGSTPPGRPAARSAAAPDPPGRGAHAVAPGPDRVGEGLQIRLVARDAVRQPRARPMPSSRAAAAVRPAPRMSGSTSDVGCRWRRGSAEEDAAARPGNAPARWKSAGAAHRPCGDIEWRERRSSAPARRGGRRSREPRHEVSSRRRPVGEADVAGGSTASCHVRMGQVGSVVAGRARRRPRAGRGTSRRSSRGGRGGRAPRCVRGPAARALAPSRQPRW